MDKNLRIYYLFYDISVSFDIFYYEFNSKIDNYNFIKRFNTFLNCTCFFYIVDNKIDISTIFQNMTNIWTPNFLVNQIFLSEF